MAVGLRLKKRRCTVLLRDVLHVAAVKTPNGTFPPRVQHMNDSPSAVAHALHLLADQIDDPSLHHFTYCRRRHVGTTAAAAPATAAVSAAATAATMARTRIAVHVFDHMFGVSGAASVIWTDRPTPTSVSVSWDSNQVGTATYDLRRSSQLRKFA